MVVTEPRQDPDVEQRLARELDPERHGKPSEGVPQDLAEDPGDGGSAGRG